MSVLSRVFGTATTNVEAFDAKELQRGGAVIVDVREKGEWDAGHIPKAKHHPLRGLPSSMGRLPEDRTLVVVCRSGNRSARATKALTKAGFDAVNLTGGVTAWQAAGLPLVNSRGKQGSLR